MQANRLDLRCEMDGRYTLTAVKVDGSGSRKLAEFENLILDSGFASLLGNVTQNTFLWARVGAGSTPPAAGQSELVSQIASSNTSQSDVVTYSTEEPYWIRRSVTKRFAAGVATGNIAEVGIGWANSGNTLFSRALVLDAEGDPTTVNVLADEFLDLTYTITVYPSLEPALSTLNINGTSHAVTLLPLAMGTNDSARAGFLNSPVTFHTTGGTGTYVSAGSMLPITSQATGTQTASTNSYAAYIPGSMYGEVEVALGLNVGNVAGGISLICLRMESFHAFQVGFEPPIPKTASQIFRFTLRITLARRDVP